MREFHQTPPQTIGPFFHGGLLRIGVGHLDPSGVAGEPVVVEGQVLDGAGELVDDAMVEVWQTDGAGRYRHPADGRAPDVPGGFIGFGRVGTQDAGTFRLATVLPGTVPGAGGSVQAPHLNIHVFARGLLDRLTTRIYFEDHAANADDPILALVPESRRHTLLARPTSEREGVKVYRFDVVLQGADETVFFDL